jgi:hypothetical protein
MAIFFFLLFRLRIVVRDMENGWLQRQRMIMSQSRVMHEQRMNPHFHSMSILALKLSGESPAIMKMVVMHIISNLVTHPQYEIDLQTCFGGLENL